MLTVATAAEAGWPELARQLADSSDDAAAAQQMRLVLHDAMPFWGNKVRYTVDHSGFDRQSLHLRVRHRPGVGWGDADIVGFSEGLDRRFVLHGIDCSELRYADGRLSGAFAVTSSRHSFRRDMHGAIVYHHLPPEEMPVPEWHLGGAFRARPFTQRYTVDVATDQPLGWSLRLELLQGVRLPQKVRSDEELAAVAAGVADQKATNQDKEIGGDFWRTIRDEGLLNLQQKRQRLVAHRFRRVSCSVQWRDDGDQIDGWADAKNYNKAFHMVDASGLQIGDDHLRGKLGIRYQRDRWVGPPGGGVRWQWYHFDLPLDPSGRIDAEVTSDGAYGSYTTRVQGRLARLAAGTYRSDGPDDARTGACYVELAADETAAAVQLDEDDPAAVLQAVGARLGMRRWPGSSRIEQLQQQAQPWASAELMQELLPVVRRCAAELPPEPVSGLGPLGDSDIGPYTGDAAPAPVDAAGRQSVPPAGEWVFAQRWRWLGPLPGQPPTPLLQPVASAAPLPHEGENHAWNDLAISQPRFLPDPLSAAVGASTWTDFVWFASTRIHCAADQRLLLALPAHRQGALWIDGVLVWQGDERADALDTAVFPVLLSAGSHRFVLRAGMVDLNREKGMGGVDSNVAVKLPHAAIGLHLRTHPAVLPEPDAAPAIAIPPTRARLAEGGVPLAWSLAAGTNVRWRRPLAPDAGQPHVVGDNCLVPSARDCSAYSLDQGELRWRQKSTAPILYSATGPAQVAWIDEAGEVAVHAVTDGQRIWQRGVLSPEPSGEAIDEEVIACTIIDDAVVVAWRLRSRLHPDTEESQVIDEVGYRCLALADGAERWSLLRPGLHAALRPMTLRRGEHARTVWISSQGDVVEPVDGRLLHEQLFAVPTTGSTPLIDGQLAIFAATDYDNWLGGWSSGWKAALRVWLTDDGRVAARRLWRSRGPSHYPGPSPVAFGDLFMINRTNNGHHQEGPAPFTRLHVYDQHSGTLIAEVSPLLDANTAPKDLQLVQGRLYAPDAGGDQYFNDGSIARMAVIAPGERPVKLSESRLPEGPLRPVFGEDCMVLAGEGQLVCLAADTAEGRAWQLDQVAAQLVAAVGRKPVDPREKTYRPTSLPAEPEGAVPVWRFRHRSTPERMALIGPIPTAVPEAEWLPALLDPLGVAERGGLQIGGQTYAPRKPFAGTIDFAGANWAPYDNDWGYGDSWVIDAWGAVNHRERQRAILVSVIEMTESCTYRVQARSQGLAVALAGERVQHGQVIDFEPGWYPLAVSVGIGELPQFMHERRIVAPVAFGRWLSITERQRRWRERIRLYGDLMQELLEALPQRSVFVGQIEAMLREAEIAPGA